MLDVYINWSKYDSQRLGSQKVMRSDGEQVARSLITFVHVTVSQLRDRRVTTKDVKQH